MELRLPDEAPILKGERVVLRRPTAADVEGRQACGRDPDIIRAFGGSPAFDEWQPMTTEAAAEWLAAFHDHPTPLKWIVEVDGRFAGDVRLHTIRADDGKARFAVGILDRSLHGRGLGQEITRLVVAHGFTEVGLHRIDLKVFADNRRAVACYEACGFRLEGRERQAALIDGKWRDDLIMGLLAEEWSELQDYREGVLSGSAPAVVSDLESADLRQLGWSGAAFHVPAVADALARVPSGEVEYLVVRTPGGFPAAKAGIDYAASEGAGTVWQVGTHPAYRRLGLADTLMDEAERRIAARGVSTARLGVEPDNHGARQIYERRGYRQVGKEDDAWPYLDDEGIEHLYRTTCDVMTKQLDLTLPR